MSVTAAEFAAHVQHTTGLRLGSGTAATFLQSALCAHLRRLLESSHPLLGCFSVEHPQGNRKRAHAVHFISLESKEHSEPQDSSTSKLHGVRSAGQSRYGKPPT